MDTLIIHSIYSRKKEGTIFFPLYHIHQLKNVQADIYGLASEMTNPPLLSPVHVINRLLLPQWNSFIKLEISNFISLVHIISNLITKIHQRQVVDLNWIIYHPITTNKTTNYIKLTTPVLHKYLYLKIEEYSNDSKAVCFQWSGEILFTTSNLYFQLCKLISNNLKSDYLNALTIKIDFCFPKLYFNPLIH